MSNNTIEDMNKALYAASFHLLEAAKYLTDVEEWRPAARELLDRAQLLVNTIQAPPEKISEERVDSVLDEILNVEIIDFTGKK